MLIFTMSIPWLTVQLNQRRLGKEKGTIIKDWGGRIPIALIYPNSYYIGMSSLGLQWLYSLFNNIENIVCERVFVDSPALGDKSLSLSIESQRPLSDFAILAFTLSYELDYFNVIQILKNNSIPLFAEERDESYPLIIAGGPCLTANPEPMASFFDAVLIGEIEPNFADMIKIFSQQLSNKNELINNLANLSGMYVPLLANKKKVTRQWSDNIDNFAVCSTITTPDTEFGNMFLIEIGRGCQHSCRFCLTGHHYQPMRFHSISSILNMAVRGIKQTRRVGLIAPSPLDHPYIEEIVTELQKMNTRLSFSSLRADTLNEFIVEAVVNGGLKTLAIAPEAGSSKLRSIIYKQTTAEEIYRAIELCAKHSVSRLKLYFMIGLPGEEEEDIDALVNLVNECLNIISKNRSQLKLILNIAPFVPKAGTTFQWLPMADTEVLKERARKIKTKLNRKTVTINLESIEWSEVQAVLSRGDRNLATILKSVDKISLSSWRQCLSKFSLDKDQYAHRAIPLEEELPWSFIDSGIPADKLINDLKRANCYPS